MHGDTRDPTVAVFGGRIAKGLAIRLSSAWDVRLVSDDQAVVERSRSEPYEARHVDFRRADLSTHVGTVDAAVVAVDRDRVGLLVTQKLAVTEEVDPLLVRLNDPEYEAAFSDLDCEVLDVGAVLQETVETSLGRASV
jgi:Trk K+ transport system NAD-binding subunit